MFTQATYVSVKVTAASHLHSDCSSTGVVVNVGTTATDGQTASFMPGDATGVF